MVDTKSRCRAVIVSTDGKSYPTRWRENKSMADLGPDEFPSINIAINDAKRLAERKKINVKRIDFESIDDLAAAILRC